MNKRGQLNNKKIEDAENPYQLPYVENRTKFSVLFCFVALFISIFVLLIVIITTKPPPPKTKYNTGLTPNEIIYSLASSSFLDNNAFLIMKNTMTNITNGCTPPPSDNIYSVLTLGSVSHTTAGFQTLKTYLRNRPQGQNQCLMYGTNLAEYRTGTQSGVVQICYGYVFAGLQAIAAYKNYTMPSFAQLEQVVQLAWPLTLFWSTNPARGSTTAVVSQLYPLLVNFVHGDRNATVVAQTFCNQYFATDNLQYWDTTFLPWYGFWAPTLVNRVSQNFVPQLITNTLQNYNLTNIQLTTRIKTVYLLGDTCDAQLACLQFLDSSTSGAPIYRMPDTDMTDTLLAIAQSLYQVNGNPSVINDTLVPVLVITNYNQNHIALNAFQAPSRSMFFAFTITAQDVASRSSQITYINAFAASNEVMAVMDYTTPYAFDSLFGDQFFIAKKVADFFVSVAESGVIADTHGTLFLLPTFATKNIVVNGYDVGTELQTFIENQQLAENGTPLGLYIEPYSMTLNYTYVEYEPVVGSATQSLPESYNFLDHFPGVLSELNTYPELPQDKCNNCWARASALAMSWRCYKLRHLQHHTSTTRDYSSCSLSSYYVTACSPVANGCAAQPADTGFGTMQYNTPTRACMPQINQGSTSPKCPTECTGSGSASVVGGIVPGSYHKVRTLNDIKVEMYVNGPLQLAFDVPADFFTWFPYGRKVGPYIPKTAERLQGGHAVMCYGWDKDNNFLCKNTWALNWNGDNFFSIQAVSPIYSGITMWMDNYGYAADYRPDAFNIPETGTPTIPPVCDPLTGDCESIQPVPPVTAPPPSCWGSTINSSQSLDNAAIDGCPRNSKKSASSNSIFVPSLWNMAVVLLNSVVVYFLFSCDFL